MARSVLVTGASTGIGEATARRLKAAGSKLKALVGDRRFDAPLARTLDWR